MTSSLTKFNHSTSVLPSDVLSHVADVISQAVTADQPYETLKEAIIARFQASQTQRLQELLSREELGAEKPTQLLLRTKRLIGETYEHFDKQLFLKLFYQRIPTNIQQHLFTVRKQLSIDKLAELTDEFQAATPGVSTNDSCREISSDYI